MQSLVEAVQQILIEGIVDTHFVKIGFDQTKAKELAKRWSEIPSQYKGGVNILGTKTTQEVEDIFKSLEAKWSGSKTNKEKAVKHHGVQGLVHGRDYVELDTGIHNVHAYVPLHHHASQLIASTRVGGCEGEWCISSNSPKEWNVYTHDRDSIFVFVVDYNTRQKYSYEYLTGGTVKVWDRYDDTIRDPYQGLSKKLAPEVMKIKGSHSPWASEFGDGIKVLNLRDNPDGAFECDAIFINRDARIKSLAEIGKRITRVHHDIKINNDHIESLVGSPEYVGGSLICISMNLKSLEGSPEVVVRAFDIKAPITSLKGITSKAADYSFEDVKITDLVGLPEVVDSLVVINAPLTSLKGCPKVVRTVIDIDHTNITNLIGGPEVVNGSFYCRNNKLTSLEGCPQRVHSRLDVSGNMIDSIEHLPMVVNTLTLKNNKPLQSRYTRDEITKAIEEKNHYIRHVEF